MTLFFVEGKNLYGQEGYRDTEDGGDNIADDRQEAEKVVKNKHYDVLDYVVRNIGQGKFNQSVPAERFMENKGTVQPVGDEIAGNIAKVEGYVVVGNDKSIQPGEKSSVEGVYATDNEKEKEFFCPKVVLQIFKRLQDNCSFRYR